MLIVAALLLARNWPFTRPAITHALQDRSARTVQIGNFRQTFFPPGCVAEDIRFLRHNHPERPPIITIQNDRGGKLCAPSFVLQTCVRGSSDGNARDRASTRTGAGRSTTQRDAAHQEQIEQIAVDRKDRRRWSRPGVPARQTGKEPYRVEIQKLELSGVGSRGSMDYRSVLAISEPPSEIHSTGKFGPWNPDDPGRTPLSGSYAMDGAKLDVFHGIAGTLSSKGSFSGALGRIEVKGTTNVPDFHITRSTHTLPISTEFQAIVNGTDGDTMLATVRSSLLRSMVVSQGSVAGKEGQKGKTATLDMSVHQGRIQDLLLLFIKSPRPSISGLVNLHAKVEVPRDSRPFLHKLRMDGDFGIGAGKLANVKNQSAINKISESARGETKQEQSVDPQTVLSELKGHAVVREGIAHLTHVSFEFAGALAALSGTYNLLNEQIDLHGTLTTNGKLSDPTSGVKSLMMKVINPFFKKKAGMKVIPFKITGTYGHPDVALDFGLKK